MDKNKPQPRKAWLIVPKKPVAPFVDAYGATRYHAYSSQKAAEREIYLNNIRRSSVKVRQVFIVDRVRKASAQ